MTAPPAHARLLVHDYCGHAFTAQLARGLARRGYTTSYVSFSEFATPKGRVREDQSDPPGFSATELSIGRDFNKDNLLERSRQEREYAQLAAKQVLANRPMAVISANSPIVVQEHLIEACRRTGAEFVYWMQDVHSEAIRRILAQKNALLGWASGSYFQRAERRALLDSSRVVVISDDFKRLVIEPRWAMPPERVDVVQNWAPLAEMPIHPRDNEWARAHFREGRKRIVYSGTLARKHDPEILVRLAQQLDADICLFSTGSGPDLVKARAAELGLDNLFVAPWVKAEELPLMLAGADVLCAFIERDAGAFSVPSKVLSYLAAGRPILASIPQENLAARTITTAGAGLVSAPGDDAGMLANARKLLGDPALRETMGRKGRAHAEANFDIERIAERFEQILSAAMANPPARQ